MKRYLIAPEAEQDLNDIKTYLVAQAGTRVARYVLREIRAGIRFLATTPIGHTREDLTDAPVRFWPVFSYLIVYAAGKTPLEVVRVLHGRRDVSGIFHPRPPEVK